MAILQSLLSQLSKSAIETAVATAKELQWDEQTYDPSFEFTIRTLRNEVKRLTSLDESGQIEVLPRACKERIAQHLYNIYQYISGISNRQHQVQQLVNQVDALSYDLLLFFGKDQSLSVQKRLSAADSYLRAASDAQELAETARVAVSDAMGNVARSKGLVEELNAMQDSLSRLLQEAKNTQDGISRLQNEADAQVQLVKNRAQVAADLAQSSQVSAAQAEAASLSLVAMKESIEEILKDVDAVKKSIIAFSETKHQEYIALIDGNQRKLDELYGDFNKLQAEISEKLDPEATGIGLFDRFSIRANKLGASRLVWLRLLVGTFIGGVVYAVWLGATLQATGLTVNFYARATASLGFTALIIFFAKRYGQERRLEEEYEFKANVALSLPAYIRLVQQIGTTDPTAAASYATFVTDCIRVVFEVPTTRAFGGTDSDSLDSSSVKKLGEALEPFLRAGRP